MKELQSLTFSLESLLTEVVEKSTTEKRPSKEQRVSYWLESASKEDLAQLVVLMSQYVENMVKPQGDSLKTEDEVRALGEEYVSWQKISDFLDSRNKTFRSLVFKTLDENSEKLNSSTPPHQTKGKIEVETSEGKLSFNREGGDRKKPTVDVERLKEIVGEARFSKLVDKIKVRRQIIPAHTEEKFSEEKFVEAVYNGEITLEEAEQVLIPGEWQTPRFTVRRVK